jgi:hypothetical protein
MAKLALVPKTEPIEARPGDPDWMTTLISVAVSGRRSAPINFRRTTFVQNEAADLPERHLLVGIGAQMAKTWSTTTASAETLGRPVPLQGCEHPRGDQNPCPSSEKPLQ